MDQAYKHDEKNELLFYLSNVSVTLEFDHTDQYWTEMISSNGGCHHEKFGRSCLLKKFVESVKAYLISLNMSD